VTLKNDILTFTMPRITVCTAIVAIACSAVGAAYSQTKAGSSPQAAAAIDQATGLALQGDAAAAAKVLAKVPSSSFTGEDFTFRSCMLSRFKDPSWRMTELMIDPWVGALEMNYIKYWHRSLTRPKQREDAERELRTAISKLLKRPITSDSDFDAAEDAISSESEKRGFHVLLGRTAPLRELMVWQQQTIEHRQVELPETRQSVTVYFLDDFVSRGWGSYATCERRSAGGWATEKGLFAVIPAYKSLDDETFSIRFLAHESQHFADKHALPKLESWELEYRAKLVELALADSSQASTVELICENRGASKDSAHGYANTRVVDDVTKSAKMQPGDMCKEKTLAGQLLRQAAKQVLLEDSKRRGAVFKTPGAAVSE
jgi:hypothetical protein